MRKIIILGVMVLATAVNMAAAKEKVFGEGVGEGDLTAISKILAEPDAFVGKTLRVEGTAVGVCAHRGCWLSLASDVEGETLRVKVEDGVIVFPKEILGETVRVEGVFTSNSVEQAGKVCDRTRDGEAPVQCVTVYQLTGSGAVADF